MSDQQSTRITRQEMSKPNSLRHRRVGWRSRRVEVAARTLRCDGSSDLTAIVNTGDDITLHGLKISPDLDIVTYTLAGLIDPKKGWGFRGETFHLLKRLAVFGRINWFNLGDRDLATHIHRTAILAEGKSLTDAAESIRVALGVKSRILPMCNEPVPTIIESSEGALHFQEYLVKRRAEPIVKSIRFDGVEHAKTSSRRARSDSRCRSHRDLPEQSAHQHRTDSRGRRSSRSAARATRKRRRRLPDRRLANR